MAVIASCCNLTWPYGCCRHISAHENYDLSPRGICTNVMKEVRIMYCRQIMEDFPLNSKFTNSTVIQLSSLVVSYLLNLIKL